MPVLELTPSPTPGARLGIITALLAKPKESTLAERCTNDTCTAPSLRSTRDSGETLGCAGGACGLQASGSF